MKAENDTISADDPGGDAADEASSSPGTAGSETGGGVEGETEGDAEGDAEGEGEAPQRPSRELLTLAGVWGMVLWLTLQVLLTKGGARDYVTLADALVVAMLLGFGAIVTVVTSRLVRESRAALAGVAGGEASAGPGKREEEPLPVDEAVPPGTAPVETAAEVPVVEEPVESAEQVPVVGEGLPAGPEVPTSQAPFEEPEEREKVEDRDALPFRAEEAGEEADSARAASAAAPEDELPLVPVPEQGPDWLPVPGEDVDSAGEQAQPEPPGGDERGPEFELDWDQPVWERPSGTESEPQAEHGGEAGAKLEGADGPPQPDE